MASILSFLGFTSGPESTDSDSIQTDCRRARPARARIGPVTSPAFAFVLSRLAAADHEITPDEARVDGAAGAGKRRTAGRSGRARRRNGHAPAASVWRDRRFSRDARASAERVLRAASSPCRVSLRVASTDDRIRAEEGDEIGRIARELRIEQADLVRALRSEHRIAMKPGFLRSPVSYTPVVTRFALAALAMWRSRVPDRTLHLADCPATPGPGRLLFVGTYTGGTDRQRRHLCVSVR